MKRSFCGWMIPLLVMTIAGCVISPRLSVGGGGTGSTTNTEFTLAIDPNPQTVTAGATAVYTVSVVAENGFTGTVNLSLNSVASGLTASLSSTSISGGTGSVTLSIQTLSTSQAGNSTLTLSGVDPANGQTQAITVTITILAAP